MTIPLLELRHVSKKFQQEHGWATAFEDLSFKVHHDEFVSIVGPSGCGKSTILRLVTGLIAPEQGDILFDGSPRSLSSPNSFMVFQSYALFPWMTVKENIALALEKLEISDIEKRRRVHHAIEQVGLEGIANAYPPELSSGSKQRVGLARAMAFEPVLLCMDEPFSTLDILTEKNLVEETLQLWEQKDFPPDSVLMVTHSIPEAIYMSDKIIVLTHKPTRIAEIISVTYPRPRDPNAPEFSRLESHILQQME